MYQQCPICKGKGYISEPLSSNTSSTCPTCKGRRIISELTGEPPVDNSVHKKHPITDIHKRNDVPNFSIDRNIAKEINDQFNNQFKTLENCFKWLPDLDNVTEDNILNTIKHIKNTTEPENRHVKDIKEEYIIKSKPNVDISNPRFDTIGMWFRDVHSIKLRPHRYYPITDTFI